MRLLLEDMPDGAEILVRAPDHSYRRGKGKQTFVMALWGVPGKKLDFVEDNVVDFRRKA
jgi:hypothetical protein